MEVQFSLYPFKKVQISDYNLTLPFYRETISLNNQNSHSQTYVYDIPKQLVNHNLFFEISPLNQNKRISKCLEYMPFNLNHHINEEFGILKLIDSKEKKPVPKLYVKVFAEFNCGSKKFYKDGYTDLRGCFDYVSLNKDKVADIK